MTSLLVMLGVVLFVHALYLAAMSSRHAWRAEEFVDAGMSGPSWVIMFGGMGIVVSALNLHDLLLHVSSFGLQASHVAVGLVLVALTGALVRKRLWLASRMTGLRTVGDLMGVYYGSIALRIALIGILFLFAVPLAANGLGKIGELTHAATQGAIHRNAAVWVVAFFLFLSSAIGGWRATLYIVGAQGLLLAALLLSAGGVALVVLEDLPFFHSTATASQGAFLDRIPGVIQFSAGIGKETTIGGIWTAVAIISFSISLIGIVLSPGVGFLGTTTAPRRGFAFEQVWMTAGLAAGTILFLAPVFGAELISGSYAGIARRLSLESPMIGVLFVALILVSLQIGVAFFAASGAHVATIELVHRYLLPDLGGGGLRLAARIMLGITWLAVALAASATPLSAAIIATLALPLAAQLLPAYLGLCWLPWISRSGVLAGFVIGSFIVIFTEPPGLIAFEGPFIDLPWGRWPLTIHSAAWGLVLNLSFCLLASLFTRGGIEREKRQKLHDEFLERHRMDFGGRAARGAKWSLVLIWSFLALGPGAIIGNHFFSQPVFSGVEITLGLPSLLVWQLFFWLMGVLLVWWLAYHSRMSLISTEPRAIRLDTDEGYGLRQRRPPWITRLLDRVAERQ